MHMNTISPLLMDKDDKVVESEQKAPERAPSRARGQLKKILSQVKTTRLDSATVRSTNLHLHVHTNPGKKRSRIYNCSGYLPHG